MTRFSLVLLCLLGMMIPLLAAPSDGLNLPEGARFINGTGQLPLLGADFQAPGFTSQGYIEVCEAAGPGVYFIGINSSNTPLTLRNSYKTTYDAPLVRITFAERNTALELPNPPEETVVQPWEFYISDPMPLTVKAGDCLYLRTFVPLATKTNISCGIISGSENRPDNRWPYGNVVSGEDKTMDAELDAEFKPTSDLLYVPFLLAGREVRADSPFVVVLGDSLTFQLERDSKNGWFGYLLRDLPHCNLAIGGDNLNNVFDADGNPRDITNRVRFAILRYATDVMNFYGHNDLGNGFPLDKMLHLEELLCARPEIARARKWRCTLTPFTRNKAGLPLNELTEADQTPDKTSTTIMSFNKALRADYKTLGYTGLLDFGAAMSTGPDSLFWKPGMANDGTHFGKAASQAAFAPEIERIMPILQHAPTEE